MSISVKMPAGVLSHATVVADKRADIVVVVVDGCGLKNLVGSSKRCYARQRVKNLLLGYDGLIVYISGVILCHLGAQAEVDVKLTDRDISHRTQSTLVLEIESRHHIMYESIGVLEIFGVLIIFLHDIRAIVVYVFPFLSV